MAEEEDCAGGDDELRASQRRLEEAQRVAHVGSFEWEIGPNVVTWSAELHRIYGTEVGQFGGSFDAFIERVHPDDLELTKKVIVEAVRDRKPFVYDHRIKRLDGTERVLQTRGDVIADAQGNALRIIGCCWDVTELKEATARLERSMSLLEATINATADGLLVIDRGGKVVAYNQRLLDLWSMTPEMMRSLDFDGLLDAVHGQLENPEDCVRTVRRMQIEEDAESFDSLRFYDGRFFERYSRPRKLGDEIVGRVWSYRDVSKRERALRRILFLSNATRLLGSLEIEQALEAVAHLAIALLGDACAIDLIEADQPRRLVVASLDPANAFDVELHPEVLAGRATIYAADGRGHMAVPVLIKQTVVGAITCVASPARPYGRDDLDLAEELARRAALAIDNARLYRGACEALRIRDEFLAIAAHEIRGPLTSIHLAAQILQEGSLAPASTQKALAVIEREDRRIDRFVDELLDVVRIEARELGFVLEEVDLDEVVRHVVSRFEVEVARSGSSLTVSTPGRTVGQWDRSRVDQVVTNLLSNAIKFGQGKPIELALDVFDGCARLTVADHGIGIPPDMHDRIFQPFQRAVSVRHYGGLGLHLARTIVDGLKGRIRLESAPGAGATFVVQLPLSSS